MKANKLFLDTNTGKEYDVDGLVITQYRDGVQLGQTVMPDVKALRHWLEMMGFDFVICSWARTPSKGCTVGFARHCAYLVTRRSDASVWVVDCTGYERRLNARTMAESGYKEGCQFS